MSTKEQIKRATANLMADMIKRSRERFAALPDSAKRGIVRELEDGAFAAAREVAS